MESEQMIELLLKEIRAGQEEIKTIQVKADAYRVQMQERMEADRKADKKEMEADREAW
jgi:hypothetical protein